MYLRRGELPLSKVSMDAAKDRSITFPYIISRHNITQLADIHLRLPLFVHITFPYTYILDRKIRRVLSQLAGLQRCPNSHQWMNETISSGMTPPPPVCWREKEKNNQIEWNAFSWRDIETTYSLPFSCTGGLFFLFMFGRYVCGFWLSVCTLAHIIDDYAVQLRLCQYILMGKMMYLYLFVCVIDFVGLDR